MKLLRTTFHIWTAALVAEVNGHASMMIPPPRNAMDANLPQFVGGKAPITPCTCANGVGGPEGPTKGCDMGAARTAGGGGQPCLWWSQGCTIGCPVCATNMTVWFPLKFPSKPRGAINIRTRVAQQNKFDKRRPSTRI